MSCSWGSRQQEVNVIGLLHPESKKKREAVAALPQPWSDFFLQGRVPEGDVFALDASSGRGGGVPFSAPSASPLSVWGHSSG